MTSLFWFPERLPLSTLVALVVPPQITQDYLPLT